MASADQAAAIGAFLSGVASVVSASFYVSRARKRFEAECNRRLEEYKQGLHEGLTIGHENRPDD